jgi:hypothetical protein
VHENDLDEASHRIGEPDSIRGAKVLQRQGGLDRLGLRIVENLLPRDAGENPSGEGGREKSPTLLDEDVVTAASASSPRSFKNKTSYPPAATQAACSSS